MKCFNLFEKTLTLLTALILGSGVAVAVNAAIRTDRELSEQFETRAVAIANSIASSAVDVFLYRDSSTVQAMIDQYTALPGVAYVFVVDKQGDIVAHTFAPTIPKSVPFLKARRNGNTVQIVTGDDIGDCLDVAAPLLAGEIGFVHVGMDRHLIRTAVYEAVGQQLAVTGITLFLGIVIAYLVVRRITRPLKDLAQCARTLATDGSTAKAAARIDTTLATVAARSDEVGHLATALRAMLAEVSRRERGLFESEAARRLSEAHYRSLIENVSDILLKVDNRGRILYATPSVRAVTGLDCSEVVFQGLLAFVHLDDREVVRAATAQATRPAERAESTEFRVTHKDGTIRLVDALFRPFAATESDGLLLVTLRDITEHRRTEAIWRIAEENQRLLASLPSVLIGVDDDGVVTKWNRAAERLLGIASADAIGMRIGSLGLPFDSERLLGCLSTCLTEKRLAAMTHLPFIRTDRIRGVLSVAITPLLRQDGRLLGALLLGDDISERCNLETQLAHAQKLESIGQLAAGIAHEINTPIQYVGDNITFLKNAYVSFIALIEKQSEAIRAARRGPLCEAMIDDCDRVVESSDLPFLSQEVPLAIEQTLEGVSRVANIVRAMKEFSHNGSACKAPTDINKLIETTILVARNEWKYVAEMSTVFDERLPSAACVAGEINQVILNLIVNAAHAIEEASRGKVDRNTDSKADRKGRITISTHACPGGVEIRVADTGVGVPPELRSKIFDPFFTTKPVGKGTGQGLAIAHAVIVEKHGGTLSFESVAGEGATFIVRLPTSPPADKGWPADRVSAASSSRDDFRMSTA